MFVRYQKVAHRRRSRPVPRRGKYASAEGRNGPKRGPRREEELNEPGGRGPREGVDSSEQTLRAKYLDYCSARVAELLLRLTADEMYLLAQDAARELDVENDESLSYNAIVRLATERIARELSLPDFQTWAAEYRKDPERFEQELLGLWESDLDASDRSAS